MIAIVGAGIAGVQAAAELRTRQVDHVLLEASDRIGGLVKTQRFRHWTYDFGVKALYSKEPDVMEYLLALPVEYQHHSRDVRIWHGDLDRGVNVDYPFENGIGQLPHKDKVDCLVGYLQATYSAAPYSSFAEWIRYRLGDGIAKHFMLPYNQKIWRCPLEEISPALVSNKIHPATVEEIVRSALGESIVGRAYQAKFVYPVRGMSALVEAITDDMSENLRLNFQVREIRAADGGLELISDQGQRVSCEAIFSTVPLVDLWKLMPSWACPRPDWPYNNTFFHTVFLNRPPDDSYHWQFFASPRVPFYRLTYMHRFSDAFAPAIVAEMTERDDVPRPSLETTIDALVRLGIVRPGDVEAAREDYAACTYPIPTLRSEAERERVIAFYEQRHVYPLGRAGSWSYINVDQVIAQVKRGVPEILAREGWAAPSPASDSRGGLSPRTPLVSGASASDQAAG